LISFFRFILWVATFVILAELHSGFLKHYLHSLLKQEEIEAKVEFLDIDKVVIRTPSYKGLPLAKVVYIDYEPSALLRGEIYIKKIKINKLNINNIERLSDMLNSKKKASKSTKLPLKIFIKEARVRGVYKKDGVHKLYLTLKDATLDYVKKIYLSLRSPLGNARLRGFYEKEHLYLKGDLFPKKLLPPQLTLPRAKVNLHFFNKKLSFALFVPEASYEQFKFTSTFIEGKYDFKVVNGNAESSISTPYADAMVKGKFKYNNNFSYEANLLLDLKPQPIPFKYTTYKKLNAKVKGDLKKVFVTASNRYLELKGNYLIPSNYFNATLNLKRLHKLLKKEFANSIPPDLTLLVKAKGTPKKINTTLISNYFHANTQYKSDHILAHIEFLKKYKKFNLPKLNPVQLDVTLEPLKVKFTSQVLKGEIDKKLNAKLFFKNGSIQARKYPRYLKVNVDIKSIKKFSKEINKLYPIGVIEMDRKLFLQARVDPITKKYKLHLEIPKKKHKALEFFKADLHGDLNKVVIDYYALLFKGHGFYATKPSRIYFKKNSIVVDSFWIEDRIKIKGSYFIPKEVGRFSITTPSYRYSSIEGDITLATNLKVTVKKKKIDVEGKVEILDGVITYEPKRSRVVKDKDIIVVDEKPQEENQFFKENVSINVALTSKKPIQYKIPNLFILFQPDLLLYKEYQKELQLLGMVKIVKGRYEVGDGYFEFLPSTISFYGPLSDPLLELHLKTRKRSYIIFIDITGDMKNPILNFDSEPYLKPNEILSLLVFGSSSKLLISAAGGSRFTSLLSNLFVKDLLKTFGIKLDTLTLTASGDRIGFEVGKKITDKIMVIYKNDEISTLIIRYEINDYLEGEVIVGPQRSGVRLYYRKVR